MPTIQWIGSPNFTQGRQGHKVIGICDHIECGTEAGTESWFRNPAAQVSAHFSIGRDGSIHQYVHESDTAWAEGIVNNPTSPLFSKFAGVNPNLYLISIEHEGYPQDGLTEVQYQSTLWLHKKLIAENGVVVDRTHITGHSAFDSVNRKDCPGPKFPWDRLFNDLGQKGVVVMQTLQIGSVGTDVGTLQGKLVSFGAHLVLNSDFDPATLAAVKVFQKDHGLVADGIVGPLTWGALLTDVPAPQTPVVDTTPPTPEPPVVETAPATHHVLEIDVDLDTGKVLSTEEVDK
jgi:N-acetylmuramoyl-L-alanine amidase